MTQEEKDFLLKDLCARLPYGVKLGFGNSDVVLKIRDYNIYTEQLYAVLIDKKNGLGALYGFEFWHYKPYLRPMSSMTEEEIEKCRIERGRDLAGECGCESDYLNSIHIDYRGLIKKGLALEAPENMYKTESL